MLDLLLVACDEDLRHLPSGPSQAFDGAPDSVDAEARVAIFRPTESVS